MTSAQVILRSTDGVDPTAVRSFFRSRGFEVSEPYAGSFSISAPEETFEATFGSRLVREGPHGAVKAETPEGPSYNLPLDRLPPDLARGVRVSFTAPPDFGPTSW